MSTAAADLDKRDGDIESYLENFCRCSTLHNKIGFKTVPHFFFQYIFTVNGVKFFLINGHQAVGKIEISSYMFTNR